MAGSSQPAESPLDNGPVFSGMAHLVTTKLNAENFVNWHSQVNPLVTGSRLLPFLDGSNPAPPQTVLDSAKKSHTNPEYLSWFYLDHRIISFLRSTLTDEALIVTIGCNTSQEVWEALHSAFQHSSKLRELRLKDELQTIQKGTRSVSQYGLQFKSLCDQLAALGCKLDPADKSHWFLRGLGSTFMNFSSNQMSLTPLPTLEDLIPKAENFEIFSRSLERTNTSSAAAFYVQNHRFLLRVQLSPPINLVVVVASITGAEDEVINRPLLPALPMV